ncbi:MAG: glutamine synthetase family protein [Candidatus Dormibacteraeota bacterium]|nr:glutamine synthetase family protein [Candidatus Dormibacteraeota bacterium]
MDQLSEHGIRFVDLQFVDVLGTVKSITIPAARLPRAVKNGEWFDGSSVEGFARVFESDMFLKPDLATLTIARASASSIPTAQVICDILTPEGERFAGDPRGVLARALHEAAAMGYDYSVATELEFFLLKAGSADGRPLPVRHDSAGYFDHPLDIGSEVRQEIVAALDDRGILVETSHHEVGAGQYELDLALGNALRSADQLVTLKYAVKSVAQRRGLHATFMPKPIFGVAGSGMHTHQTLTHVGKETNAFYDRADQYHLSPIARHFIAGQLAHAPALCAVVAPLVNSYKRFVPGFEAPVAISWAQTNRSALIRVPRTGSGEQDAIRVEFRAPDPSCNPYLAFAVMLHAGLAGIRDKLTLPPPVEENLYAFDPDRLARYQMSLLPGSLDDALRELRLDAVMREALGDHLLERFIEVKEMEWQSYEKQVSAWELEAYLETY